VGVLRLAHVDVRTPDLELSTAYYTEVLGLTLAERSDDTVYLKCWDEEDHHSLRLRQDPRTGMDLFSFRVEAEDDLDELENKLLAYGCEVQRVSRGEAVGQGESIRFEIPSGQTMELVWELEKTGNLLGKHNPMPVPPPDLPGIAPPRVDHLLINAEEVAEAYTFFRDVLGFRLTEQVLDANGHQIGVWLERSHSPHDVAIVNGPNGALHHFAFWLDDWDQVRKAADVLAYNGVQIDQGPTRHGVTRGNTIYFFDPLGIRNEVFTGGYRPDPDFPEITWSEEQFGRGLFYYENTLSQRFLSFHT
jgi:catechol 2,3-dioxygenase